VEIQEIAKKKIQPPAVKIIIYWVYASPQIKIAAYLFIGAMSLLTAGLCRLIIIAVGGYRSLLY